MEEADLLEEHQQLQQQLQSFVERARENEHKMRRFHEQELNLIGSRTLPDLLQNILYNYRRSFSLDAVTLVLYDPEYEIRRILEEEGSRVSEQPNLIFITQQDNLTSLYGPDLQPRLSNFEHQYHQTLFSQLSQSYMPLRSVALLPLVRYDKLIGSFNLGSFSEERFAEKSGTEFLQRLTTIMAICIENATNNERLKRVGLTDTLTGINNRRFFDQRLQEEIGRSIRANDPISCLFIDIDYFKNINDQYGHQNGDVVLRKIASLIRAQLRNCDVIARYSGEEFVVLLANTAPDIATEIAERIRLSIAASPISLMEIESSVPITVSIGISSLTDTQGMENTRILGFSLVDNADHALYDAKSDGRNRVALYLHDNYSKNSGQHYANTSARAKQ
ncbi:MAG: sensor domain-containing diguanylate cyclase [Gammaproteobacteria bacterium]|nr:sensor domain-containing diguanylate cyclase [Gammaproteobacteria bacterium]